MGSISGFGIGSAALTAGWAALRYQARANPRRQAVQRLGLAMLAAAATTATAPTTALDVKVDRLRSAKGVLRICLTADPENFPGCVDDAHAVTRSVPAASPEVRFEGLTPGSYAVAVIHDANNNAKLDTLLGIPREGFGFSRNPAINFGPPRFKAAAFDLDGTAQTQPIRMRYLL